MITHTKRHRAKTIIIDPSYAEVFFNRGNAKYNINDCEGAIEDYDEEIKTNPNYAKAYYNRGNAKYTIKDFEGAIEDYNKVIEIKPNDADTYYSRGKAKYSIKDYEGAIEDYNKAIEFNPNYAKAYSNRGDVKKEKGDKKGAKKDYDKAIEINSKYEGAYDNHRDVKNKIGDYKEAIGRKYSTFDNLKEKYDEKRKVFLDTLKEVERNKQKILDQSIKYKLFKFIKHFYILVIIIFAILGYFLFLIPGAIIAGIVSFITLKAIKDSNENLESNVLNSSGEKWKELKQKADRANIEIDNLLLEYNKEYNFWCEIHGTYPPDWDERKRQVLKSDGYCCTECGYPRGFQRRSRELHVHHIISLAKGGSNNLSNLTTLCHICHRNVDHQHNLVRKNSKNRRR